MNSQGPEIGDIDSLEIHSDGSFFDFERLSQAEVQEEMIDHLDKHKCHSIETLLYEGEIDSDGGIVPDGAFSSTDDKTSTNARIHRTARGDVYVDKSEFNEPSIALRRLGSHDMLFTRMGMMRTAAHH